MKLEILLIGIVIIIAWIVFTHRKRSMGDSYKYGDYK